MIHLYCCYTEAHAVLFREYFVPSLTNNVIVHALRIDLAGPGDFLSTEFLDCIRRKIDLIIGSIDSHPGEIIIWSDIDIVLFGDIEQDIRAIFQQRPDLDMAFQREGFHTKDVNSGFIAMRCNASTKRFFEKVKETMLANPEKNEQPVANELLSGDEHLVTWDYLPLVYMARSHGWPPAYGPLKIYHANCTAGADGIKQKQVQFAELKKFQPYAKTKVCIVTPEIVGPRRNSGIGTHAFYYSRHLAQKAGYDVTVLLTAETAVPREEDEGSWAEHFKKEYGINLVHLDQQPMLYPWVGWFNQWFSLRSQQVYAWLRGCGFDIIHFQDLNADGFFSLQARETGAAFQKCAMTVTLNGPSLWARQGMKRFAATIVDDALINYMESYCLAKADLVLSPSQYALDWCESQGWELAAQRKVCPYLIEALEPVNPPGQPFEKPREIIFFGRLETRKGLWIFLKALQLLNKAGKLRGVERVWFLGGHSKSAEYNSNQAIGEFMGKELPKVSYTVEARMDHLDCLKFLAKHRQALVVTPSLSETLGYTVIESLELNLNIVATAGGAIPELFEDKERLCAPDGRSLAALMGKALARELSPPKKAYTREKSLAAWEAANTQCEQILQDKMAAMEIVVAEPMVSVCIPHFNYGWYLKEQLESLARQSYANFEVCVVDDGSTDETSRTIFAELEKAYKDDGRFRFFHQENAGLCAARNRMAAEAKADYIIFCDADNFSAPNMISVFARAIQVSGADCLACHMYKFRKNVNSGQHEELDYYTPLGPVVEVGPYCDPFGDANFIIRKEVFQAVGGFRHVPQTASEDWEFLAELSLKGYRLDVVPLPLFYYREHGESNMRQTPYYDTRMRVIQPYLDRLPERWQRNMLESAVGAYEHQQLHNRLGLQDANTTGSYVSQLQEELREAHVRLKEMDEWRRRERARFRKASPIMFALTKWLDKRKK